MDAIFRVDGNNVVTSPYAAGPWDPSMQHGSPPAALVVWAAERIPTPVPMRVARVTVDLMRPVPVAPLTIESEVLREGRKIQLCAVRLCANGVVVVGATVLKIKVQANELPPEADDRAGRRCRGRTNRGSSPRIISSSPFVTGMSLRAARGRFGVPGPGAIWYRVDRPIVEGSPVSQAMRAMAAADFCNGTSSVLDFRAMDVSQRRSHREFFARSRSATGSCSMPSPGSVLTARGSPWRGSPMSVAISAAPSRVW